MAQCAILPLVEPGLAKSTRPSLFFPAMPHIRVVQEVKHAHGLKLPMTEPQGQNACRRFPGPLRGDVM
jgi:hypothetical protein